MPRSTADKRARVEPWPSRRACTTLSANTKRCSVVYWLRRCSCAHARRCGSDRRCSAGSRRGFPTASAGCRPAATTRHAWSARRWRGRIGAAEAQHLDVAAGRGHQMDQAAGVDVLTIVARLGVGHREPQAADAEVPRSRSERVVAGEAADDGTGDNSEVEGDRPMLDVVKVMLYTLPYLLESVGLATPAVDLRPARDARLHPVA